MQGTGTNQSSSMTTAQMEKMTNQVHDAKWQQASVSKFPLANRGGTAAAGSSRPPVPTGILKRSRAEDGSGSESKRVKVESPVLRAATPPGIASGSSSSSSAAAAFPLTDTGVKAYIKYVNGRIRAKDLAKVFSCFIGFFTVYLWADLWLSCRPSRSRLRHWDHQASSC